MKKIPRKQSSSLSFLLACVTFLFLPGFFVYALKFQHNFFIVIILACGLIALYLFYLQNEFQKKQVALEMEKQEYREKTNLLEANIAKEILAAKSFRKKITDYSHLKTLTEKLGLSLSLQDTADTLSQEVNRLFASADHTVILYLFHLKSGKLEIIASQQGQKPVNIRSKHGDIFDEWVLKSLQSLLVEDTHNDFRFDIDKIVHEDSRPLGSIMAVPLLNSHQLLGILRVDSPTRRHFSMEDLRLLTAVGDLGAVAIENAQLYERLRELAIRDSLTGLYLRRYFLERLGEEIGRHLRNKKELSCLMIDLDYFKKYNDTFGHMAGDIVLRNVGIMLTEAFNEPGQIVCRYGGEEFCVLLPECTKSRAAGIAEELRKKVEDKIVVLRREETRMTVSIGVASFPKDAVTREELIDRADRALYKAKQQGRNKVVTHV